MAAFARIRLRTARPSAVAPLSRRRICEYVDRVRPRGSSQRRRAARAVSVRIDRVQDSHASPSDLELIAAMTRGDERAASVLYDRHAAVMYGLALRITGEVADAEDVVIDAFNQAWRDASRHDGARASVAGWLTTIVRTRALDLLRSRGRRARMQDSMTAESEPIAMGTSFGEPDIDASDRERATGVVAALHNLPDAQRTAIELAFFEGLTHQEVAERLHEPLGTVKTRIRLGMNKLRDLLHRFSPDRAS